VQAELADLNKTLENIESARPFDQLTLEDVTKVRPDINEKVNEMVKKGNWQVPGYNEKFGENILM
jgi:F-type H+-transporting ATPase subunit d